MLLPHRLMLQSGEVAVLRVAVVRPESWLPLLASEEHVQAARITYPQRRAEFICCRGSLRAVLGHELGCAPAAVPLVIDARGKPGLEVGEIAFSIAHTQGLGLLAFAVRRRVGVDVEPSTRALDVEAVIGEFLNSADRARVESAPSERRKAELLRAWVRNEAAVKATGQGLVLPADPMPAGMTATDLDLGDEYVGAVVADGSSYRVKMQTMREPG